nr:hypothetical protein [Bacteroidota bacterium]
MSIHFNPSWRGRPSSVPPIYSDINYNEISTYKEHNSTQYDTVTKTMNAYGEPLTIA